MAFSQALTGAIACANLPLEYTDWSLRPAMAVSFKRVKSALREVGTRWAVVASSALYCSSSAVFPCAADIGRREAPVACWEMVEQASAADAKSPYGPDDGVGLALGVALAWTDCPAASGALAASGAEHPERATTLKRAVAMTGWARFFKCFT